MKNIISISLIVLLSVVNTPAHANRIDSIPLPHFLENFEQELVAIQSDHQSKRIQLVNQLNWVNTEIRQSILSDDKADLQQQINLLLQKIQLKEELDILAGTYQLDLTKKRYKKGIELIKMIYEKLLALDHHFSSLHTYQNVMSLSNPNTYPEFQKSRELIESRLKKENAIKVPSLLNANPYLSTTFSLVASMIGGGNNKDRENDLEEISCILDFTATMSSELSTIFYETEFLKESNIALKKECLSLFVDYTKVVGYFTTLDKCRNEDDWEKLYETLDIFAQKLEDNLKTDSGALGSKSYKQQVDLEFSVDRLLEFINKYNAFISQGEKYYKKFKIIASNYPNEAACLDKLPANFSQLQSDIDNSIYKFNEAYDISELTGSKLKDLLYGFSD